MELCKSVLQQHLEDSAHSNSHVSSHCLNHGLNSTEGFSCSHDHTECEMFVKPFAALALVENKYETMKILFQSEQKKQRSQPYHGNLNTPFLLFPLPLFRTIKFKNSKMQKIHALKRTRNFRILKTFPSPGLQSINSKNSKF